MQARTRTPTTPPRRIEQRALRRRAAPFRSTSSMRSRAAPSRACASTCPFTAAIAGPRCAPCAGRIAPELLARRVRIARAEPLGPLEGRPGRAAPGPSPTIAAPHLGVNEGSVCVANVGSVAPAEPRQRGQDAPVAREDGSDGHRHPVSFERDDPAQDVLVELLRGERCVGRVRAGADRGCGLGRPPERPRRLRTGRSLSGDARPGSMPCGAVTPAAGWPARRPQAGPLRRRRGWASAVRGCAAARRGLGGGDAERQRRQPRRGRRRLRHGRRRRADDADDADETRADQRTLHEVQHSAQLMQAAIRLTRASAG